MTSIKEIRYLNDICKGTKSGIYKQWIYKKNNFMKICDYMQKINYALQDLNSEIANLGTEQGEVSITKNVTYIIVLVDWVRESFDLINKSLRDDVKNKVEKQFVFSNQNVFDKAQNYFIGIRSFVVAHPLSTNRHKDMGLDGNYICIDIRNYYGLLENPKQNFSYKLNFNGLQNSLKADSDIYLFCYSDKDDNSKYFRKIGIDYADIYCVAELYIDKLYELDKFLSKLKQNDFGGAK